MSHITTLFFDLGGVCLSNGWDREQRRVVTEKYGFDYDTFDRRHRQVVDALERGQLTLHEYLRWTIFYEAHPFTIEDITTEMMQLSVPFPETLEIVRALRQTGKYLLATINNESRELNEYRIKHFGLRELFSAFFSSCYLNLLKPQRSWGLPDLLISILVTTRFPHQFQLGLKQSLKQPLLAM